MVGNEKQHETHAWLKLLRATMFCRKCEEPCFETDPERAAEFYREHYPHNEREGT